MHHSVNKKICKKEIVVNINIIEEEFEYLTGHVINEKNLFPAMGYLFLIWEMISLLRKQDLTNVPVVFEDINFIRAVMLSRQNSIDLILSIMNGNIIIHIINLLIWIRFLNILFFYILI